MSCASSEYNDARREEKWWRVCVAARESAANNPLRSLTFTYIRALAHIHTHTYMHYLLLSISSVPILISLRLTRLCVSPSGWWDLHTSYISWTSAIWAVLSLTSLSSMRWDCRLGSILREESSGFIMSIQDQLDDYLAETKAPVLYGITFPLLGVTMIVVLLRSVTRIFLVFLQLVWLTDTGKCRLYCRLRIVKKMQNSDYLIMVSMVSFTSPTLAATLS